MCRRWYAWNCLLAATLFGCHRAETSIRDTGAREMVRVYFEAVCARDWPRAYGCLAPVSQERLNVEAFGRRAQVYRTQLGFEPERVSVRSCEERADSALAHVVVTGHTNGKSRQYKDGAELRRGPAGWGVVLPRNFGEMRR